MKPKIFSSFLVVAIAASAFSLGLVAKDRAPARKAPALRVDNTPVSEGKAPVVSSYADVVEPVQRAVVSVYSKKIVRERVAVNPLLRQFFGNIPDQERQRPEQGLGSGVIVSPDGYILTNNHVVEGADELKVSLADDRELIAKVIGTDPKTDIAVIKIEGANLATVTIADSDKLRVGDVVFAVGNPLGVGQTVTMGIVSAKGRRVGILDEVGGYESFIQTDASINMGNSGGALIDAKGRLVGINSAIISPSRGNIGIGFAVPINLAASVMRSLIETGSVARGYLGVQSQNLTPDDAESLGLDRATKGVIITDVTPKSAAEAGGLKSGDVILGINNRPVASRDDLRLAVGELPPGSKATLKINRNGKEQTVTVTLGKLDENPDELISGVRATPLTPELRTRLRIPDRLDGMVITEIAEDSPYIDRLAPNLLITQIDRQEVSDLETARSLLTPGRHLLIVFYRGAMRLVNIEVK